MLLVCHVPPLAPPLVDVFPLRRPCRATPMATVQRYRCLDGNTLRQEMKCSLRMETRRRCHTGWGLLEQSMKQDIRISEQNFSIVSTVIQL